MVLNPLQYLSSILNVFFNLLLLFIFLFALLLFESQSLVVEVLLKGCHSLELHCLILLMLFLIFCVELKVACRLPNHFLDLLDALLTVLAHEIELLFAHLKIFTTCSCLLIGCRFRGINEEVHELFCLLQISYSSLGLVDLALILVEGIFGMLIKAVGKIKLESQVLRVSGDKAL